MAELKDMTVRALRDLARKALGRGHSKLKTKRELVEALQAAESPRSGGLGSGAPEVKEGEAAAPLAKRASAPKAQAAAKPAARSRQRAAAPKAAGRVGAATAKAAAKGAKRAGDEEKSRARGKPAREPARPRAGAKAAPPAREAVAAPADGAKAPARRIIESEPDPDGYMVARVAGEEALRGAPRPMTESALEAARKAPPREAPAPAAGLDEVLGDLPWSYGDDVLVALPRDPTTLFLYWDHALETLRRAWVGLDGGRPQLRVSVRESGGEWATARTIEFALESRSYYVHDLASGRVYRAEIHLVDRAGRDALLARPSNEIQLPPAGPSLVVDDRFMYLPWGEPLKRLLREARPGGPFSEELRAQLSRLSDWSRFAGRAWGGWGGSAGGMGGRPFSPVSSPSSPAGAWGRPDGKGR
jgi:hypothetical protein